MANVLAPKGGGGKLPIFTKILYMTKHIMKTQVKFTVKHYYGKQVDMSGPPDLKSKLILVTLSSSNQKTIFSAKA